MMRRRFYIVLFQLFVTTTVLFGQGLSLAEIRKDFKVGHKEEETCKKHLEALEEYANCPVGRGYEAAYHMFMAKHAGNPLKKMGYLRNGKKMLEEEIAENPNNIELRYIRLCIQYYIPSYLGYKDNIEEDKGFLVNNLYKLKDKETKQLIYTYLKGAKMYSDNELTLLGR
ncbi:hypothetical protein [Sphingobacterium gobiense]|nr:hypothetical protein [Sphingobacterium gobiense]